jgi:hypothetical protein
MTATGGQIPAVPVTFDTASSVRSSARDQAIINLCRPFASLRRRRAGGRAHRETFEAIRSPLSLADHDPARLSRTMRLKLIR